MPQVSTEASTQYWEPVATGPVAQCDLSANTEEVGSVPSSIAASSNFTSQLILANGFKAIAAAVTLSQAGSIAIQRYIDKAGLVAQGAAVSTALTAATPGVVNSNDGLPFQSCRVTITNSSSSNAATVSNFALLLNAA